MWLKCTFKGLKNRSNNYGKDLEKENFSISKTFAEDTADKSLKLLNSLLIK